MNKEDAFEVFLSKMKKFSVPTYANLPFAGLTTFGSGGTIKLTVYPDTKRKLIRVLRLLDRLSVKRFVLGAGSNVLASDDFFDGVVVATKNCAGKTFGKNRARVLAGTRCVSLAAELKNRGLSGGEFLACLPASVGGAVACNAGCFGQDVSQILVSAEVYAGGKIKRIKNKQCGFSKRSSIFKHSDWVVLSADFAFGVSDADAVSSKIAEFRQKKAQTQPLGKRSAGCVLYHDRVAVSALIDKAGLKGYSVGDAEISPKHAGFVVNNGRATSSEILQVIRYAQRTLYEKYGVTAELEVTAVNFKENE